MPPSEELQAAFSPASIQDAGPSIHVEARAVAGTVDQYSREWHSLVNAQKSRRVASCTKQPTEQFHCHWHQMAWSGNVPVEDKYCYLALRTWLTWWQANCSWDVHF